MCNSQCFDVLDHLGTFLKAVTYVRNDWGIKNKKLIHGKMKASRKIISHL